MPIAITAHKVMGLVYGCLKDHSKSRVYHQKPRDAYYRSGEHLFGVDDKVPEARIELRPGSQQTFENRVEVGHFLRPLLELLDKYDFSGQNFLDCIVTRGSVGA